MSSPTQPVSQLPPEPQSPTKVKTLFSKLPKKRYLLVAFFFLLILTGVVLRLLTPSTQIKTQVPQLTNFDQSPNTKLNFVFNLKSKPSIPETIHLYQTKTQSIQETVSPLISEYKLLAHPKIASLWLSENGEISLSHTSKTNIASFSHAQKISPQSFPSVEKIVEKAQSFIENTHPSSPLHFNPASLTYLTNDELPIATSADKAQLVSLNFEYKQDNLPIHYQTQADSSYYITLTPQLTISKAYFSPQFSLTPTTQSSKPLTLDQAINQIKQDQYTTINSLVKDIYQTPTPNSTIEFDEVRLEYRLLQEHNLIYPYYHFIGRITSINIDSVYEVITPAITLPLPPSSSQDHE